MALSQLARDFAAEIKFQDWSDAPYRADRAGHQNDDDRPGERAKQLTPRETDMVRMNVMWVTAQVLAHADPTLDPHEFAEACGVNTLTPQGAKSGGIPAGLRTKDGRYCRPGTWDVDEG